MTLSNRTRKPSYADVAKTPNKNATESSGLGTSNVKVVVRVRPENKTEQVGNYDVVVRVMNENVLVFDPKEQGSPQYGYYNRVRRRDIGKRQRKDLKFAFDSVFGPGSKNSDIYKQTTKQILNGLLEGYNCSVFAYGATGAGKTHTMLGNPQHPGVMYLTMLDLYDRICSIQDNKICDVAVSYLEVYNEQIHDLLVPGKSLPVREDAHSGVVIPGLSLHKPKNAEELLHMLHFGNQKRTQHPTDANAESSRSHAVFQVFVRQKDRTANISTEVRVAKMCLVDLAGSERATVTKNRGTRFREGANINRSLLALGNCINALADSKYKGHVPYRDSKLTRLLKDSLGGNCQTVMIAAVSPSSMTFEDTYNTLKYADRAKHIQATLKKNVLNVDFHVARYSQIVVELRAEIEELKGKLQVSEENKLTSRDLNIMCQFREKLDGIYCKRLNFTREYLDADLKSRDLKWKIVRKEKCLSRLEIVDNNQGSKIKERLRKTIMSAKTQINVYAKAKNDSVQKLEENRKHLDEFMNISSEENKGAGDQERNQELSLHEEVHQAKLALTESEYQVKHLSKVVRYQERELQASEKLVLCLLSLVRKQYTVMNSQQLLTSDLHDHYSNMQTLVEGREVTFADQSVCLNSTSYDLGELLDFKCPIPGNQSGSTRGNENIAEAVKNVETASRQEKSESFVSNNSSTEVHSSQNHMTGSTQNSLNQPCVKCKMYACMCTTSQLSDQPCSNCRMYSCMCSNKNYRTKTMTNCAGHTPAPKRYSHSNDGDNSAIIGVSTSDTQHVQKAKSSYSQNTKSDVPGKTLDPPIPVVKAWQSIRTERHAVSDPPIDMDSSHDLNSTFTLDKPQKPEVKARTPVIVDKFIRSSIPSVPQIENVNALNSTQILTCSRTPVQNSFPKQIDNDSSSMNVSNKDHPVIKCNTVTKNGPSYLSPIPVQINVPDGIVSKEKIDVRLPQSGTVTKDVPTVLTTNSQQKGNLYNCSSSNNYSSSTPETISSSQLNTIGSTAKFTNEPSNTNQCDSSSGKSHVVRAIHFDYGNQRSPTDGRSWADVVKSPETNATIKRMPLRQVNGNSSPLAMPLSPSVKNSHNALGVCNKTSTPNDPWIENAKENTKMLQQLGLPSLVDKSSITPTRKPLVKKPSYMQMTKAAKQRTNRSAPRMFKRSQSTTSIGRPGWQL